MSINRLALCCQNIFFELQLSFRNRDLAFLAQQLTQPRRSWIWNPPVNQLEYVWNLISKSFIGWCHSNIPPRVKIEFEITDLWALHKGKRSRVGTSGRYSAPAFPLHLSE